MRVAFDEQIFAIQRYGGISRVFAELAHQFATNVSHGVELQPIAAPVMNEYLLRDATTAEKLVVWRGRHWSTTIARSLLRRRHKGPADVVHNSFYLPRMQRDYGQAQRIVTVHDMIPELFPQMRRRLDFLTRKREYVLNADRIICVSEYTKRDLLTIYPDVKAPVSVVHSGVGPEFTPGRPPLPQLPSRYILHVGGRSQYKDATTLLRAFPPILARNPDLHLVLVGGGALTKAETDLIRRSKVEHRVMQISLPDLLMPAAYANAAIFVVPSRYEGFGLPVLEAMASGAPTVLCESSALPEVGGGAALYFGVGDSEGLTHRILAVLDDQLLRERLAREGIKRARSFSWELTAEGTARVYTEAMTA